MKKSILIFFSCISLLSFHTPIANSNAPTISFVSITGSTSTITPGQRAVFTVVLSSTNGVGSAYVRFDSPSGAQAVGYGSRTSGTPGGQETWTMNVDFPRTAQAGTWVGVAYAASTEKIVISSPVTNMTVQGSAPAPTPTPTPTPIPRPLPPRAENIFVSPTTITPGANVTITFNVIFSRDQVRKTAVVGFREQGNSSGAYYSSLTYESTGVPSNQLLKAQVMIPTWAPIGKYELQIVLPYDADGLSGLVQIKDSLFVGTGVDKTSAEARTNLLSQQIIFSPVVKSSYKQTLRSVPMKFTATSNLPVFIYNNTNDVCEYKAGSISLKMAGRCLIALSQEGNDVFAPAKNVNLQFLIVGSHNLTVTCTKGKVTKKVSGINPKCPAGYKKK